MGLRTPPSSLRKPGVSDTTPNRAFLRGFPATQFPNLGLCGRSRILLAVFGVPSPHLKFPFPATRLGRGERRTCARNSGLRATMFRDFGPALQLFRIESERLKLPAPFGRGISEPLDADAAGEATFYGPFDKIGGEDGERDGHVDLPDAAFLATAKLCDRGHAS